MASSVLAAFFVLQIIGSQINVVQISGPQINLPSDFNTNFLMLMRWIHFLAGITWIGLLYFFNLVNVPFMKELDASTRGKVMPALMTRALLWFRMSAALTVLAGLIYWGDIVAADARNGQASGFNASSGPVMGSFFLIWTIVWGLHYVCLIPGKGILDKGTGSGGDLCRSPHRRGLAVSEPEHARLGEQPPAGNRSRRRHRMGNAAQCVGSDLAHPEAADSVDAGQCGQWHGYAGKG
jgi:uncharacterized membrane protein